MSQVNDALFQAMEAKGFVNDALNDRLRDWLLDRTGLPGGDINTLWYSFFVSLGSTAESLSDARREILTAKGYPGSVSDQMLAWANDGCPE